MGCEASTGKVKKTNRGQANNKAIKENKNTCTPIQTNPAKTSQERKNNFKKSILLNHLSRKTGMTYRRKIG
ncbi:unnamed protein product [Moneuplotes crassus]|uniref:Uncharacterized protein n=1 Tax=Euplotes crassus TaxID=5936 RepID=A0AAD1XQB6_EUPCR|nr:unnamed protein product [Moneuplotes crassus]